MGEGRGGWVPSRTEAGREESPAASSASIKQRGKHTKDRIRKREIGESWMERREWEKGGEGRK